MDIRFASTDQAPELMGFINNHWRKGHILAIDRALFDWQYLDQRRGRYNFIIAADDTGIHAILGFIPLSQFDAEIEIGRLVWLAIWKVTDAFAGRKLGKRLLDHLIDVLRPKIIGANAISDSAAHRYRSAGWHLGRLSHHYILHPDDKRKLVLTEAPSMRPMLLPPGTRKIEKIDADEFARTAERWRGGEPQKSPAYYENRYAKHPTYSYWLYRIRERARTSGLLVIRQCEHAGASALRIVDFVGPEDALLGASWGGLLEVNEAEYIDFYSAGIHEDVLRWSGFSNRVDGDGVIIPNYFEPFSRTNVEIDTMTSIPVGPTYRIFKGDSDQDRPNLASAREAAA